MNNIPIGAKKTRRYAKIFILLLFVQFPNLLLAIKPSASQNFIIVYTPNDAYSSLNDLPVSKSCPVVQYIDGLGRPVQSVAVSANSQMKDLVTMNEYDALGRDSKTWLPVVSDGNGAFIDLPGIVSAADVADAYPNEANPFSVKVYDNSPLNRKVKEYGAGQDWQNNGKGVEQQWLTNDLSTVSLKVRHYSVSDDDNYLKINDLYPNGQLYVTKQTDEDGNISWSFTDKQGRTILNRSMNIKNGSTEYLSTYYVYDNLGRLRYVLPPIASDAMDLEHGSSYGASHESLNKYAYYYRYDLRGNCIEKKLPGSTSHYFVYDKADRLILSQNGIQRSKSLWSFSKYDALGRVIITGIVKLASISHQSLLDTYKNVVVTESYTGTSACFGYTNSTVIGTYIMSKLNYYDNYSFRTNSSVVPGSRYNTLAAASGATLDAYLSSTTAKGLLTGTVEFRLDDQGARKYTALYYDKKGRIVKQNIASFFNCFSNNTYGYDYFAYAYDYLGKVLQKLHTQSDIYNGTAIVEGTLYTYDQMGRCLTTSNYYGSTSTIKAFTTKTYNALGQLDTKKFGNNLETQTYKYNVRGWLTEINGSLFSEKLQYEKRRETSAGLYNGNICESSWKYLTGAIHQPDWQLDDPGNSWKVNEVNFSYTYDNLNRLTHGFKDDDPSGFMEMMSYDKHGNIQSMLRGGIIEHAWNSIDMCTPEHNTGLVDDILLTYNGNQLLNAEEVTDSNDPTFIGAQDFKDGFNASYSDYSYDANGNLIRDLNKNIVTMKYNNLNLPDTVQMLNGNFVTYMWDGSGNKVRSWYRTYTGSTQTMPIGSTMFSHPISYTSGISVLTDYFENFVYENQCLRHFFIDDGIAINANTSITPTATPSLVYNYYLKDHLGNTRVVFHSVNDLAVIDQVSNYYPFGMEYGEEAEDIGEKSYQDHLYSGKEFDDKFQMNSYDFGARTFSVDVPVWRTVDPLTEKHFSLSPYAYCANNPLRLIDPDGKDWIENKSTKAVEWRRGAISTSYPTGWTYLGLEYKGLRVLTYESNHKTGRLGLEIRLGYNDGMDKNMKYNFIQNCWRDHSNVKEVDWDEKRGDYPFYQHPSENRKSSNTIDGYDIKYRDSPEESHRKGSFEAEVSLMGERSMTRTFNISNEPNSKVDISTNNQPIITLKFGYKMVNGEMEPTDIKVVNPSDFQKKTINQIKAQ